MTSTTHTLGLLLGLLLSIPPEGFRGRCIGHTRLLEATGGNFDPWPLV